MTSRLWTTLIMVLLLPLGACAQEQAVPVSWEVSTPEQQGVDSEMLVEALRRIRDERLDVRSVILIRNDRPILEAYVHPYDRETLHNVKSVSKSILSAVVGIALRDGILESVDQPLRDFFPQHLPDDPADAKNGITLRHLLTMTAGLDLDENGPQMQRVFRSEDWIRETLSSEMVDTPGDRFVYSTPLTHLMVGILTEASGESLLDLARERLFDPLGFGPVQWTRDPHGYYFGGAELFLRPRDMAAFGRLYLNDGRWGERQLVPRSWITESTANRMPADCSTPYGYWWWVDTDAQGFHALGWGGQRVSVRRDLQLVGVVTAGDPGDAERLFAGFDPTEMSDDPLPPNPEAVAELEALVRELASPSSQPVPPLPEIATRISGHRFELEQNPRGIESFTFDFTAGAETATVTTELGGMVLETSVGLDGRYRLTAIGASGPMPDGNRIALRGHFNGDAFVVESHPVGDPVHTTLTFRFEDDALVAAAEMHPVGARFELRGR